MNTKDLILGITEENNQEKSPTTTPGSTTQSGNNLNQRVGVEPADITTGGELGRQNSGDEKITSTPSLEHQDKTTVQPPVQQPSTDAPQTTQQSAPIAQPPAPPQRTMTYADMMQQLSPYKPPTEEEMNQERKRMKREAIFASIGDGLNAFHQAYAATRGIKPITDNESMTGKLRERYERLRKEHESNRAQYVNAYIRAMQMDDESARDSRNWRRTLERDAESDRRDKRDFDNRVSQQQQQQDNWQKTFERQSDQWKQEFEMREKQYGRQNALAWANHNLQVQAQKDNKELREKAIAANGAKAVRGKQLAFSDGNGNSVSIYENVWKGSMEQVYDAIVADFDAQRKNNTNSDVPRPLPRKATAQQKDDYVKQHWHKSAAGRQMMQTLSGIDPANMTSSTTTEEGGGLGWGSDDNSNQETDW